MYYLSSLEAKVLLTENLLKIGMPIPFITPDLTIHLY